MPLYIGRYHLSMAYTSEVRLARPRILTGANESPEDGRGQNRGWMRAGVELEIECAARIARKKAGWKPAVRNVTGVKSDEGRSVWRAG